MRIGFMGTPEAAVPSLNALASRHEIISVHTQPRRRAGRSLRLRTSAVEEAALGLGLIVSHEIDPPACDAIVVAAFGRILSAKVLEIPRLGCYNVHFSLLPRWRGAAPVARAIMAGDQVTGVTTMLMDEGLDTGPIMLQKNESVRPDDTTGSLTERLGSRGADLIVDTLSRIEEIEPAKQDDAQATLAPRISAAEAELDFNGRAEDLHLLVRALQPRPGAFTFLDGRRIKVIETSVLGEHSDVAGRLVATTGEGVLVFERVQPEGRRVMTGAEFCNGFHVLPGTRFGR